MVGTFCIPKLLDVLGSRYRMYMFVNENNVVIVDDETFSERLINRIKRKRMHQGETKERFLYNYIAEFMAGIWRSLWPMSVDFFVWKRMCPMIIQIRSRTD